MWSSKILSCIPEWLHNGFERRTGALRLFANYFCRKMAKFLYIYCNAVFIDYLGNFIFYGEKNGFNDLINKIE